MITRIVAYLAALLCTAAAIAPTPGPVPRRPLPTPPAAASPTAPSCTPTTLRILTVGDSITVGVTMTSPTSPGYRAELAQLLDATCVDTVWAVAAVSGTKCDHWAGDMAGLVTAHQPDLVLLACGTNDNLLNAAPSTVQAWEAMYAQLIADALAADPDVQVYPALVQLSAPLSPAAKARCVALGGAYASSDFLREREAVANAAIRRAVTISARVPALIDYTPIPRGYLDHCGVHPNPAGYDAMGRIAYTTIAQQHPAWPAVAMPCGLADHAPGDTPPMYEPCEQMAVNPGAGT